MRLATQESPGSRVRLFDMIGGTMWGTVEILMHMRERPDQLLALVDKVTDFAVEDQIRNSKPTERLWV